MKLTRRRAVVLCLALPSAMLLGGLPARPPRPHLERWQGGDLVFMTGTSLRSRIVRLLQWYSTDYSHVGMVVEREGKLAVIHADPAAGKVIAQSWEELAAAGQISGGAIYRVRAAETGHIARACAMAQQSAHRGVPFDHDFDLKTPDRVYCTELVLRAWRAGGVDLCAAAETEHPHLLPAHLLSDALQVVDRF